MALLQVYQKQRFGRNTRLIGGTQSNQLSATSAVGARLGVSNGNQEMTVYLLKHYPALCAFAQTSIPPVFWSPARYKTSPGVHLPEAAAPPARFRGASDPPAPPGGRRASRRWHDAEAVAAAVPRQQAAGRRRAANGAQLPPPERHRRQCRPWLPISRR